VIKAERLMIKNHHHWLIINGNSRILIHTRIRSKQNTFICQDTLCTARKSIALESREWQVTGDLLILKLKSFGWWNLNCSNSSNHINQGNEKISVNQFSCPSILLSHVTIPFYQLQIEINAQGLEQNYIARWLIID
jgi:hypothetical protein